MPIPLILWGGAAILGAIGIGAGLGANSDMKEAKRISEEAKNKHEGRIKKFNNSHDSVKTDAENLAKTKIKVYKTTVNDFLQVYERLQRIKINNVKFDDSFNKFDIAIEEIKDFDQQKITYVQTALGLVEAAGAGASTGLGALGLVSAIGYASTGTAISSLSGVAATNATLAWFGGGSLAAGGLGMAGGVATLAGIVVAPALAVFGISMAVKADKALTEAYMYKSQIDEACEKIDVAVEFFNALKLRISEFNVVISRVEERLKIQLPKINPIIDRVSACKYKAETERKNEIEMQKAAITKKEKRRIKALKRRNSIVWKIYMFFIKLFNPNYKALEIPNEPYIFKLDPKYQTEILANDFLTEEDKKNIFFIKVLGKSLKTLLEIPLIDADGKINNETNCVIEESNKILSQKV